MKNINYFLFLISGICIQGLKAQDIPGGLSLHSRDELTLVLYFVFPSCSGVCDGQVNAEATGGQAPYSYSWSNGATGPEINDVCSGYGEVTVTDASGNTASEEYELPLISAPNVYFTGLIITQPTDGQNNGSISLDSTTFMDSTFYHVDSFWSIDSIHFIPFYIFPHLGPGVYHLYIIDPIFGCVIQASNEIILYDITAVEDPEISFHLFPNPVTTVLNLYSDLPLQVELLDMNGRKIFSEHKANDHLIQMTDFPHGIYILQISDGLRSSFEKIVKAE